jgi:hypothetical protein
MRTLITVCAICTLVLGLNGMIGAHVGPTFFLQQVNPSAITIDGKGDDPGWNAPWWDDANTITTDMLGGDVTGGEFPTKDDWDAFLKVGWSAPPDNMLYFYSRVKDDILNDEAPDNGASWRDDQLEIIVDSNHDGGDYSRSPDTDGRIAQQYAIRAKAGLPPGPGSGDEGGMNNLYFIYAPLAVAWQSGPPWFEAAIDPPIGRTNVTYAFEGKLAMWDLASDKPETSQRHINAEGQTIGLVFQWDDSDAEADVRDDQPGTQGPDGNESWTNASHLSDFVLIGGPIPITAVEVTSWGAIKATFQR